MGVFLSKWGWSLSLLVAVVTALPTCVISSAYAEGIKNGAWGVGAGAQATAIATPQAVQQGQPVQANCKLEGLKCVPNGCSNCRRVADQSGAAKWKCQCEDNRCKYNDGKCSGTCEYGVKKKDGACTPYEQKDGHGGCYCKLLPQPRKPPGVSGVSGATGAFDGSQGNEQEGLS
jgi:hypothetical protein